MAHLNVKPDPAFLKMQAMNKVRHQYFRFNARTAKITTIYMVVVPSIIGYIAWKTDVCVGPKDNPSPFMLFELVAKLTVLWNKGKRLPIAEPILEPIMHAQK
ncbi:hypothetical protein E4U24_004718 [Claviceps purpurea]|nr:hypothetical protein E4U11_000215 [Claviceps purpurea]KAG6244909.1 hypothetical protein E4U24_004718 [Claviceps purpurea]